MCTENHVSHRGRGQCICTVCRFLSVRVRRAKFFFRTWARRPMTSSQHEWLVIGYASLAENMARSGEISRIWDPSIVAHNATRRSHGQDLFRVWLQPSFRRGEMFVFPLPYPCYTTWALGKTVQVKFLMIDTINLDMNDPGKRKTHPDSTEFSLFFCNLGFSAT